VSPDTVTRDRLHYDPYDPRIHADPYPVFARLRAEAPLYYDATYDFYALSRHEDVERSLVDAARFRSGHGSVLELIKAGAPIPSGLFIFEDPPMHTMHRGVLARVFTPRRVAVLEPQVRAYCARALDPFVGARHFDFVHDLAAQMPMRVIGMLLGIPEADQARIRDHVDQAHHVEPGQAMTYDNGNFSGELFADYVGWRAEHPADDLMTMLLNVEFDDETGATRRLTRDEVLVYVNLLAGAGNETTGRLIGWIGKVLGDHPDQRRQLVEDPSLIPNAVEEVLRFEPPAHQIARYVAEDVELHGHVVPAGSALLLLTASANRDDRRFPDGDTFDVHRRPGPIMTFGFGPHFCLGAALARLEGRVALEEVLARFPEWEVDEAGARLASTTTTRGWDALPVSLPG
jgi:cytochrome P450